MRTRDEVADYESQAKLAIVYGCKQCGGKAPDCACRERLRVEVEAFEACVPRDFWTVAPDDIHHNRAAFDDTVRPYCDKLRVARAKGYGLLLLGDNGVGKCHAAGQGILMYNGTARKVEDISTGDLLMGPDSKPRTVLRTTSGHGKMYKICPVKGNSWKVNENHVLVLVGCGRKKDQVVEVSIREWLEWGPTRKWTYRLFRTAVDFPPLLEKLPIDPYFLGVLLGDGYLGGREKGQNRSILVTTTDPEILSEIKFQCKRFGLRIHRYFKGKGKVPSYGLSGPRGAGKGWGGRKGPAQNPIASLLEDLDLLGKRSGNKFIPHIYKVASRSERLEILAGLIDTDGSLLHSCYDYISKLERLAQDVAFVARSLGFAAYVRPCKKSSQNGTEGTYYRLCISGFTDSIPCRVPRKKAPPRRQAKSVNRTWLDIVPTGKSEPYYGFILDGDSRYLLDDFTVTHNSIFASYVLTRAIAIGFTAYYTTLPRLDYELKRGFRDRDVAGRMREMLTSDFLALDEMGKEHFKSGDSYMRTQVERLLKDRYDDGMPTLIATNASAGGLKKIYGATIASILMGKYQVVSLEPGDYRKLMREEMERDLGL